MEGRTPGRGWTRSQVLRFEAADFEAQCQASKKLELAFTSAPRSCGWGGVGERTLCGWWGCYGTRCDWFAPGGLGWGGGRGWEGAGDLRCCRLSAFEAGKRWRMKKRGAKSELRPLGWCDDSHSGSHNIASLHHCITTHTHMRTRTMCSKQMYSHHSRVK